MRVDLFSTNMADIVLPPIRVTGLSPLAQPYQHRRHLTDFCHPDYSCPQNVLFRLCAIGPAHLIPVSQTEWFNRNGMDVFQKQMGP
jgi:hypothetical protein